MSNQKKKILVVRAGRVGDIVMITPALNAILELYPESDIHVLTSPDGRRVLKGFHENITKLIIYDRSAFFSFVFKYKITQQIKCEDYTDIFCFEMNPSFLKMTNKRHASLYKIDNYDKQRNYAQQCMEVVAKSIGRENYNRWMYLPVDRNKLDLAKQILKVQGITDQDFIIALHPSFSGLKKSPLRGPGERSIRSWSPANFSELAILLNKYATEKSQSMKVIVDVLPDEKELGQDIVAQSGGVVKLFTPEMDFERYKGTLQRADLVITPNTGPMHIAAAVGTTTIALFAGLDPVDCGAYVEPEKFIVIRAEDMPQPELGLSAITPQKVFEICQPYLPG